MITVWITKYALTLGILTEQVEEPAKDFPNTVHAEAMGVHFHGKDWHRTKEDAVARAEAMREAKLVSLEKQIINLEHLSWEKWS